MYVFPTAGTGKPQGVFQQKVTRYYFLKKITGAAVWAVMTSEQETYQGAFAKIQKGLKVNWRKAEEWMDTGQVWEVYAMGLSPHWGLKGMVRNEMPRLFA